MYEGETRYVTESPWLSAMEDMEYVKTSKVMEWKDMKGAGSKRELERFVKGIKDEGCDNMVSVYCLVDIQTHYVRPVPSGLESHLEDTTEI
jgi:hypothetical protein